MSAPSRAVTVEEQAVVNEAARVFAAAVTVMVRDAYGVEVFEAWSEEARTTAVLTTAVQALLHPEAYAIQRLNLDFAAYGFGLAIGAEAMIPDATAGQILAQFNAGFQIGRQERAVAATGFRTAGSA